MIDIEVKRGSAVVVVISPDSSSNQTKEVMGGNLLNLQFTLNSMVQFQVNDWCTVYGENYYINKLPVVKKTSSRSYEYSFTMESDYYQLVRAQYMFLDASNELQEGAFSLMGNADTFLDLLVKNANRIGAGWSKGTAITSTYQNMTFNSEDCLSVLGRLAQQFGTEYYLQGKKIYLDKKQKDTGITLSNGKNKGLYEINRQTLNDAKIITRLYAFGSDKNLPPDYRDYATRLRMTGGAIYLEKNVATYGLIESVVVLDDVYPHRTGKVTGSDITNPFVFTDIAIDFDVNAQLLPGVTAKVTFNTGQLAGYTFDIAQFNNTTKRFTINLNKDEKAIDVPSTLLRPQIGDEYVLVDIQMPNSYVVAAEAALTQKAQTLLDTASAPQFQLQVDCDPAYFRRKNLKIDIGDLIWIYDLQMGINQRIRVAAFTRAFDDEFNYQLTLADAVTQQPITELYGATGDNSRQIQDINSRLNNRSSENNFVGQVFMADVESTSDTTGMFPLYVNSSGKVFKKI
ncbi:hypothetical protein AB6805_30655 [Chitinophaga sp. RCC_12]|uniref:hypothetical protein n=1 Tax=Chitinophaga sp. RCC_12 TaxID=3239226 RepID=UPI0035256522